MDADVVLGTYSLASLPAREAPRALRVSALCCGVFCKAMPPQPPSPPPPARSLSERLIVAACCGPSCYECEALQ